MHDATRRDGELSSASGFAGVDGIGLYYETQGHGHPLVLIHMEGLDRRMWDDQVSVFAAHYRVIRFDLPGYGKSARSEERRSPARDVYGLLRFLGIEAAYVLGASLGGATALDLTLEHPEVVDALILAAPGLGGYLPSSEALDQYQQTMPLFMTAASAGDAAGLVTLLMDEPFSAPAPTPDHAMARQRMRDILTDNVPVFLSPPPPSVHLDPPTSTRLSDIHAPTLILLGDRDAPAAREIAATLEAGIAGARLIAVPGAPHLINLDQPETFNRLVLDFLGHVDRR